MAETPRTIMQKIRAGYELPRGCDFDAIVESVFSRYRQNIATDVGGCIDEAFNWAVDRGMIKKRVQPLNLLPVQLPPQTPERYLKEYEASLQACDR